ncbi:helix-turn-helix domain-containing protein [Pseudoclavibacter helvolus]|uniref:helix-turn-helix domain-containing protein n=1 Tax=Pseudoclavibacter helvolus TaxID=255205 RepID=UPI003C785A9E
MMNSNDADNSAGAALRVLRIKAGLTLADIAVRADTSESYLSNVERGKADGSRAYFAKVTEVIVDAFKETRAAS